MKQFLLSLYMWAPLPDPCYNIAALIQNISFITIIQKSLPRVPIKIQNTL